MLELHSYNPIAQNNQLFDLKKISLNQILLAEKLKNNSFVYYDHSLEIAFKAFEKITVEKIKFLAVNKSKEILIHKDDFELIKNSLKDSLLKVTRALSMGEPQKKANMQANLLSMNLENVYKNPFDDELLNIQFKSCGNFSSFLLNNKNLSKTVFKNFSTKPLHHTISQPLLASLMLQSFLQSLKVFTDKEIENLFLTSYFKDIGTALIPNDRLDSQNLSNSEINMINEHTSNSISILKGRVNLSTTYLNIIENHHMLNNKINNLIENGSLTQANEIKASGIESALISATDVFMALISDRPYRNKLGIYDALEFIKRLIADDYPQEYRSFVMFIKNFLSH